MFVLTFIVYALLSVIGLIRCEHCRVLGFEGGDRHRRHGRRLHVKLSSHIARFERMNLKAYEINLHRSVNFPCLNRNELQKAFRQQPLQIFLRRFPRIRLRSLPVAALILRYRRRDPLAFIIHGGLIQISSKKERRAAASSQDGAKPLPDLRNGDSLSNH